MDWLGQSQYLRQTVFWPSLSSAVSELLKQVIFSKHALVNMLVTYWSHFLDGTDEYLKSILYSTILCHSSSRNNCKGRVNIKYYIVPGYKKTGAAKSNKDRCADDKLKKMALRVTAESLSEEEIAGLKEAIPCDGHQQQRLVNDEIIILKGKCLDFKSIKVSEFSLEGYNASDSDSDEEKINIKSSAEGPGS
ncbi:hypothetical protein ZIOFF_066790 [Zingiber officinale]|uniref:Uncharacterized protein n=1 Tax=Zingiber officinale TaxID=94328 RepID=A0A8J5F3H8_ZINOF|nr:hypothetical protein ZIOFF_066790 [Zingiber officinale]